MTKHLFLAALTWPLWFILRMIGILTGFVIVPIALLFRTERPVSNPDKQAYPSRKEVHLPRWAWIWDNDAEGMMSWMDEWPEMCWNGKPYSFISMWQWAAWRNPANNMRFIRGIAVYLPDVKEHAFWGKESVNDKDYVNGKGWNFIYCKGKYFPYYGFNWVGDKYYAQLGHKIEPKHFTADYTKGLMARKLWKGMTFRPIQKRRDNSKYAVNQKG